MRSVGYCRVSTREQSENTHALEQQIARVKSAGASEVFVDVESGRKDARANFQRLMDLVYSGMVQQVIITRLDRLARSLPTLRRTLDQFQASGVNLKALDDSIDLQSAAGKFHINLLGAVAEMESDRLSERILHGWNHFRSRQVAIHPPFGYMKVENRFELDVSPFLCLRSECLEKAKAQIARELVETYLTLKSLSATCRTLNQRYGFQIFGPSALRRWLTSPVLQGAVVYFPRLLGSLRSLRWLLS